MFRIKGIYSDFQNTDENLSLFLKALDNFMLISNITYSKNTFFIGYNLFRQAQVLHAALS